MPKRDMIIRLEKARQLLVEIEESLVNHPDIDAQYHIDVGHARDICIDFASHLIDLEEMRVRNK